MLLSILFHEHSVCSIAPVAGVCSAPGDLLSHGLIRDSVKPDQAEELDPSLA
jgi:hypothetical protein